MADRMLLISWGDPCPRHGGARARGVQRGNRVDGPDAARGRIESFDVALMSPNADMNGYVAVRGTAAQINAMRQDEEFLRSTADASMIVDNLRHIEGAVNEGVARQLAIYQEAIAKVPQRS